MTDAYHITHVSNLASIIAQGGLWSENDLIRLGIQQTVIGYEYLKLRRQTVDVPCGPCGVLSDYVPMYFAPRSPMLYAINRGLVKGYSDGQTPIVHLVASVQSVAATPPFVFTDGHAVIDSLTSFYDDLAHLNKIDWPLMTATYWNDTLSDNDRKRRRQAEFLVHHFLPWPAITKIGVINPQVQQQVRGIIASAPLCPMVTVHKNWYY